MGMPVVSDTLEHHMGIIELYEYLKSAVIYELMRRSKAIQQLQHEDTKLIEDDK